MVDIDQEDPLVLAGKSFHSRLLLGTAGYPDAYTLKEALAVSESQIVTMSVRRRGVDSQGIVQLLQGKKLTYLPNTAGCYTAQDAILTAELAREALQTNWIKLEVIGDERTLYPNGPELLRAAEQLVQRGFAVFPYCTDDPVLCQQLENVGCAAVMPLASPIGSGLGLSNPHALSLIRDVVRIPVIVDAGIGTPSDVVLALELGVDAVLVNTAVAQAGNCIQMARAMHAACQAGRLGYLAGRISKRFYAKTSSPAL